MTSHRRRPGRPPGPTRDLDERRVELLDAATAAIREHGPNASMSEIAAAAGITKPILYRHFGDKAGLAAALARRMVTELTESLAARITAERPPRQRMREAIATFVDFAEEEKALYGFLLRTPKLAEGDDLVAGVAERIAITISAGLRTVGADSGPAELWSHAIIGAVLQGAESWQKRPVVSREQLVDDLTHLLWDGLASTGLDRIQPEG